MLENFALVLDLNSAKDSGSVALSVESAGSTLGSFTVTSGAGESVEIPDLTALGDVYDVTNEDDMSATQLHSTSLHLWIICPMQVFRTKSSLMFSAAEAIPMPKMLLMKMPQKQSLMLSLLKQAQPDLAALSLSSTAADGSSNTLSRYLLLLLL